MITCKCMTRFTRLFVFGLTTFRVADATTSAMPPANNSAEVMWSTTVDAGWLTEISAFSRRGTRGLRLERQTVADC